MNLSFKNRIALNYMVATAIMIAAVFVVILVIVKTTVIYNLDKDLVFEANKHTHQITIQNDSIHFINILEWREREHTEVQFHPVFIQIVDIKGQLMDKSPNLNDAELFYENSKVANVQFNTDIKGRPLRQIQIPIIENSVTIGYMLAAMSTEEAEMVMQNLKKVLLILYPIVLMALFGVARYLAGRSINPIKKITDTANHITKNNLDERIELPHNKDELYTLTASINELLQRMQEALEREKQFTSDASHELRTPLAVLTGTLEVLLRKPRTEDEYKEKIGYSINEINRMSDTVDQLLMLARVDNSNNIATHQIIEPIAIIDGVLIRYKEQIEERALKLNVITNEPIEFKSNPYYVDLIFDNLIANAIKYSNAKSTINISLKKAEGHISCVIGDEGNGISSSHLKQIFSPFYRANPLDHKEIKGNGLGLSIVKKACDALGVDITVESEVNKGTKVKLLFPNLS